MIKWFQRIFIGHVHKWKILKQEKLGRWHHKVGWYTVGVRYDLQCEECGKITHYDAE